MKKSYDSASARAYDSLNQAKCLIDRSGITLDGVDRGLDRVRAMLPSPETQAHNREIWTKRNGRLVKSTPSKTVAAVAIAATYGAPAIGKQQPRMSAATAAVDKKQMADERRACTGSLAFESHRPSAKRLRELAKERGSDESGN